MNDSRENTYWLVFGIVGMGLLSLCSAVTLAQNAAVPAKPKLPDNTTGPQRIQIKAQIDPRVELMSVLFHLAGNSEYNQCRSKYFMLAVNDFFGAYRNHPAIQTAKRLRDSRGISYDAVMSMAAHIKDINTCAEIVPLNPLPQDLDNRWTPSNAREFLENCRDFIQKTNFSKFLEQNKDYYDQTTQRLQKMIDQYAKLDWFDKFFGSQPDTHFNLVVSILNGPSNYGTRITNEKQTEIYCILGASDIELFGIGYPVFRPEMVSTVVHEFAHSYCNPIVDKHLNELKGFGEKLYPILKQKMEQQDYGNWQTMMRESLVRASEVRYAYATAGPAMAQKIAKAHIERGFLWMNQLSDLLAGYEKQRDKYPDFESFFPKVVEFFQHYDVPDTTTTK